MKTASRKVIPLLALILSAGSIASITSGCAGTTTKESTGEYVDDAAITTKVKSALAKDETVKASEVSVETFKGIVQLSGFVNTSEEKSRAGKLASGVPGVKDVKNNIQVK